jgi:serine/threonine protein kinase
VKTYKSSGVKFNVVNELPTQVKNRFLQTVNEFLQGHNDFDRIENILEYIAGGACGRVYDLGDGFIVKINKFGWRTDTPDGDILKDLQGIPFIPKVYWYSEDNRFIVVQKIEGVTTGNYLGEFLFGKELDLEKFKEKAREVFSMVEERGWILNDIHGGNCMIDRKGRFWIVDVGLFQKADSMHFGESGLHDLISEADRIVYWHNKKYNELMASREVA